MPNNPVNDAYNPPGSLSNDFDKMKFNDVPINDLFWFNTNRNNNTAHRKIDSDNGQNTKTREVLKMEQHTVVYQKI